MSPIQPLKRRRLNTATKTLSQPFKSPFKTPLKSKPDAASSSPTKEAPPSSSPPTKPNQPPPTESTTSSPPPPSSTHLHPALASTTTTPLPHALQPHPHHQTQPQPHQQQHTPSSNHLLTLRKRHTALLTRLASARSALECSSQALGIESSSRDPELRSLILKWKEASREAAEELFGVARDRVNRMGGVGGLRGWERERRKGVGGGFGWDLEGKRDGGEEGGLRKGGGEGEDGTGYGYAGRGDDVEEVDEREEGVTKKKKLEEEDYGDEEEEQGYTMDMMLQSLNVDLGVIGFDKGLQKWVD